MKKAASTDDAPDSASAHPALSLDESKRLEIALFGNKEAREWAAMQRAGRAIGEAVMRDFFELGKFPTHARILVLAGKGHNGGDALLAAKYILELHPRATAVVCFAFGDRALRPLAMQAWRELGQAAAARIVMAGKIDVPFDICLDGIFGFQFRAPVDARVAALIKVVNAAPIRLRAAVDLPSGLGDENAEHVFRADFTYATGIVKTPLLEETARVSVGRIRYLDLGFFCENQPNATTHILTSEILSPLRTLRPSHTDKRDYGHLFIVGGSRHYPGAVLMSVLAALRSGAGLVTAFVPETLVHAFAARAPEAIWCGLAETPEGGLALENSHTLRERLSEKNKASSTTRPTALLLGPGLSREREALAFAAEVVRLCAESGVPLVIDADALQPEIVSIGKSPRILTPHAGEYSRIEKAITSESIVVRKGPLTRISRPSIKSEYLSLYGGPVLSRGGSGDLLAGLTGGLLAKTPRTPFLAACQGAVWHGMAADCLSQAHGQHAVQITQLLDFLPAVLRETEV